MKHSNSIKKKIHYLLPLKWSLHYVMTEKEWQDFRVRVKRSNPNWERCSCPKKCRTTSLDEQWKYDKRKHIKRFVKAEFICGGCHWLKTPPWRYETWQKEASGELPPLNRVPHIIECLGWTKEEVEELRKKDMQKYSNDVKKLKQIALDVEKGTAEIKYWSIDLKSLKEYGYSEQEIIMFEDRLIKDAQKKTEIH